MSNLAILSDCSVLTHLDNWEVSGHWLCSPRLKSLATLGTLDTCQPSSEIDCIIKEVVKMIKSVAKIVVKGKSSGQITDWLLNLDEERFRQGSPLSSY